MEMAKGSKRKRTSSKPEFSVEPSITTLFNKRMTSKINNNIFRFALKMDQRCSTTAISDEYESSASCISSNESFNQNRIINFSDPEVESVQTETSTCDCSDRIIRRRREMSLLSEVGPNSPEVDSEENKPQIMPTESEIDEFFAVAEKDIQKQFENKYNYDIVKDIPLEGRYEWIQVKP